jgi:hypothetical protein
MNSLKFVPERLLLLPGVPGEERPDPWSAICGLPDRPKLQGTLLNHAPRHRSLDELKRRRQLAFAVLTLLGNPENIVGSNCTFLQEGL